MTNQESNSSTDIHQGIQETRPIMEVDDQPKIIFCIEFEGSMVEKEFNLGDGLNSVTFM